MKNILVTILSSAVLGSAAFAGTSYVAPASKEVVSTESHVDLYRANEWSLGIFGTYAFTESTNERILGDHAFGGGIFANYFITKNIGLGLEAQALSINQEDDAIGSGVLNVFYRMPIGYSGWAPYIYGGGGLLVNANNISTDELGTAFDSNNRSKNNDTLWEGHVGAGVEYRFTPHIGVFTDARWTMPENVKNNFPSVRAGVTFAF